MSFIVGDPLNAALQLANAAVSAAFTQKNLGQLKRQLNAAKRYYEVFRRQRAFYRTVYQYGSPLDDPSADGTFLNTGIFAGSSGAELSLILEAFAETVYTPAYSFVAADVPERQGDYLIQILFHFNGTPTMLSRKHERMQLKADQYEVGYLALTFAATCVDSINYWFRFEEYIAIVKNERRFEHLMNAEQYAMKRVATVNTGLGMSMDVMGSARTRLVDYYGKVANTAAGLVGYSMSQGHATRTPAAIPAMRAANPGSGINEASLDIDTNNLTAMGRSSVPGDTIVEQARPRVRSEFY